MRRLKRLWWNLYHKCRGLIHRKCDEELRTQQILREMLMNHIALLEDQKTEMIVKALTEIARGSSKAVFLNTSLDYDYRYAAMQNPHYSAVLSGCEEPTRLEAGDFDIMRTKQVVLKVSISDLREWDGRLPDSRKLKHMISWSLADHLAKMFVEQLFGEER